MFSDLLSSRLIQSGLVFFMLIVSGSLFYSWHVRRIDQEDLARTNQFLQQLKNRDKLYTTQDEKVSKNFETLVETQASEETNEAQAIVESPDAFIENTERLDIASSFLPDNTVSTKEETTEDMPVSPFGFGPYPKIPADYPQLMTPTWIKYNGQQSRDFELMDRVLIKLWNQGDKNVSGAVMKRGLVYPLYPNTTYVKYREVGLPDGTVRRFISSASGTRGTNPIIPPGGSIPVLPKGVTAINIDNAGINPYEFLNLK